MKRILVTGAAGFVGRHALTALASAKGTGDRIVGIGRGTPQGLPDNVVFRHVNLLNEAALSAFVAEYRPTDVLHLAAIASVQHMSETLTETWRVNLVGLLNLAEAMACSASKANFFFVSSGEVYGRAFLAGRALSEDVAPEPLSAYARSKWFGEQILADVLPQAGIRLVILRPFNHIGAGQDERFVVPSFAGQIARIEAGLIPPILEVGNLEAYRDFLPIGDVVRAYVALITGAEPIESGSVYNIASGKPRSIGSVLADLRRHATKSFEVRTDDTRMRPSDISTAAGDASRLKAAIGWEPTEDWNAALVSVLADARGRAKQQRV